MAFFKQTDGSLKIVLRPAESLIIEQQEENTLFVFNESEIQAIPKGSVSRVQILAHEELSYVPSPHQAELTALFEELGIQQGLCVDIGAFDGMNYSHTLELYRAGWRGLSVECQPDRFARLAQAYRSLPQVALSRHQVTPASVVQLLQAERIPYAFDFLSLDIDSYDYYVLAALLKVYRPSVICAEINEVIPLPIRFAVHYDPDLSFDLNNRFFGQSLAMLADLAQAHGYVVMKVNYQDVFLIDAELVSGESPSLESLYEAGVRQLRRPEYYDNYPFDVDMLARVDPETALHMIQLGWPDQKSYHLSLQNLQK